MFRLTIEKARVWQTEVRGASLRAQIVTLRRGQHIKHRPYAFTEHGIFASGVGGKAHSGRGLGTVLIFTLQGVA